ncbi:MAG TPA: acyltransferase [Sulfuriferula sp.]|nr:acyltransferase [Sulfuriferula sp.]
MTETRKIGALDGLRGYMALWVFVTHVTTMATIQVQKHDGLGMLFANGEFAVGVFIVLSGFVITLNLQKERNAGDFYIRRVLRLFPVYWVCLIASVLILDLSIRVLTEFPWSAPRLMDRINYLQNSKEYLMPHLLAHIFLLHGLIPDRILPSSSYAFMGQAWSLTLEWQYYLVAPLLFWFMARIKSGFLPKALVVLALIVVSRRSPQSSFLLSYLWLFAVGGVLAQIYQQVSEGSASRQRLLEAIVLLAAITAAMKGVMMVSVALFGISLWAITSPSGSFSHGFSHQVLANRIAMWLGKISYGFYCSHMVAIFLCAWLLVEVLEVQNRLYFIPELILGSLGLALIFSALLSRYIEIPAIELGRQLVRKRKLVRAALVARTAS